jgi:hypothetical protein
VTGSSVGRQKMTVAAQAQRHAMALFHVCVWGVHRGRLVLVLVWQQKV